MTYEFLAKVDDRELRSEIVAILTKLQTLAEGGTVNLERSSKSSETPLGPPGFMGLSQKDCPPPDRSLFDHFRWRFEKAVEQGLPRKRLYFLLWEAERSYQLRVVPASEDNPRRALVLTRVDEDALIARVIEGYAGTHSYRVHLELDLPQGWIEKVREDNNCEPETGLPRPKWRELDDWMKRSLVKQLREAGKTQEEVARFLGVSRRTVATYSKPTVT